MSALHTSLRRESELNHTAKFRIEPELRAVIGDSTVASLSNVYSGAVVFDKLRFVPFPTIARVSAYTPYLDEFSAKWVREKAPPFLIFDGSTIDFRHPWAETPAMWLEVYRWYDTRLLGVSNLLLERRAKPRFHSLASLGAARFALSSELSFPASTQPVFWKMACNLSIKGKLRKLLLRLPDVMMRTGPPAEPGEEFRVIPEVLVAPVLGPSLPGNLAEFAALLTDQGGAAPTVKTLSFGGPGQKYYGAHLSS